MFEHLVPSSWCCLDRLRRCGLGRCHWAGISVAQAGFHTPRMPLSSDPIFTSTVLSDSSLHPNVAPFRYSGITSGLLLTHALTMLLGTISCAMCAYFSVPNLPLQKLLGFSTHQVSVYITLKVSAEVPPFQICPRYPVPSLLFQLHPASEVCLCSL